MAMCVEWPVQPEQAMKKLANKNPTVQASGGVLLDILSP
jgi:hypothetical protein